MVMVFFFSSILRRNRCDKCDKRFQKIEELMQHTQVVHGKADARSCKEVPYLSQEKTKTAKTRARGRTRERARVRERKNITAPI
jgi:transcriptional regulator NrdR family protein